jgi:hypothetical protein
MMKPACLALVACLATVPALAAPNAGKLESKELCGGSWFLSLVPGQREALRIFALAPADTSALYLRRFMTPAYYLDALSGDELKVLLWPSPKERRLDFAPGDGSFKRETNPALLEYRKTAKGGSPYEGDWEIGNQAMAVSIRRCEKRAWSLVLYFPGDPLSALPMGYYPLYAIGDGAYRSSSAFADSLIELEYDGASDALLIRPLFKERPLAAELYDPVRAWPGK